MQSPSVPAAAQASPLLLLMRVNLLALGRKFKALREQSMLLTALIAAFIGGYLILSFWLFQRGLEFLASFPGLGVLLTERLMYLLFAFLFALLLLSNLVISYTNFFRNGEAAFLLTLPVPFKTIFRWKCIESVLLASWAFVFLISPLLAAYGLTRGVQWHFYLFTFMMIGLFIMLPGIAGAWLSLNLARFLDRKSFQVTALTLAVITVILAATWLRSQPVTDQMLETRVLTVLDQLLAKTRFAQHPFLPSYWLTFSVLQWAEGLTRASGFFMLVLLSQVMFFGFLTFTRLGNQFYTAAAVVQSRGSAWGQWEWFRQHRPWRRTFEFAAGPLERLLSFLPGLASDTRALLAKDARVFWRDTAQWGQSVVLFGLLCVYIINLRHFSHQLTSPFWVHLVSFLNLGACSLNLATLTTRFVYPQFSLEGRRMWIVGLAPMGLGKVVMVKYWLAGLTSLVVTFSVVVLSCVLLHMQWNHVLFFGGVMAVMTFTLNGLAMGLGVLYPNLKENNPSKIVSGFGGTFCLVLSFIYILACVLILSFGTAGINTNVNAYKWAVLSIGIFTVQSAILGWLPMKLALRSLRTMQF